MNAYRVLEPIAPGAEPKRGERLRTIARCIALLADEVEALEQGDAPRARDLAEQRAALDAELRAEDEEAAPLYPALYTTPVGEALQELTRRAEGDRRAREELEYLRDFSLPLARGIPSPAAGGRYPDLELEDSQYDVRL